MARRILVGEFSREVVNNPTEAYKYATSIIGDHFYGSDYNVVTASLHYNEGKIDSIRFGSFDKIDKDTLQSALDAGFGYICMSHNRFEKIYEEGYAKVDEMLKLMNN